MGVQVNRIEKEYIFNNLQRKKIELSVHGFRYEFSGLLIGFDEGTLTLKGSENLPEIIPPTDLTRIFFSYQNNYYTFEAHILGRTGDFFTLENPRFIYRDPQRKYERIKVNNLKIFFLLEGEKIELDFPKTDSFIIVSKPELADDFDPKSIVNLINNFRNFVRDKVSEHQIVMYRDKQPQAFEERLIIKKAKTLWLPSTEEDFPLHDPNFSGNIIVKKEVEDFLLQTGTPKHIVHNELVNILYQKSKANIFSEIYCPILYHEYAVGFIHLLNKKPRTEKLDSELLNYVIQFSQVLSYSLEINGYYRQHRKIEVQHQALVLNISAAGLLFTTDEESVSSKLNLYADLDLNIKISEHQLVFGSRIMRKFSDNKNYYFGAQFLKASDEDFHFLFEYLYGKPYNHQDGEFWEGGAPPPDFKSS